MNKSLSLFMLSSIVACNSSVDAWSKNGMPAYGQEDPNAKEQVPVDDRSGMFEADYLLWKTYQEDMNYAIKLNTADSDSIVLRPKKPAFDWSSGLRIGFGAYTSDEWDVSLRGTYFYSDGDSSTHGNGTTTVVMPAYLDLELGQNGTRNTAHWKLNYGTLDFNIGRETALSRKFSIHPFIGARAVWMRQTLNGTFVGVTPISDSIVSATQSSFKYKNDVWGVGPRAGFSSSYYFAKQWSFLGGLSGSFVLGNFQAREKASVLVDGQAPLTVNLKDSDDLIRTNVEGSFGIGWDMWFNKNKNRVYVQLLCESSYWFGINQLMDVDFGMVGSTAVKNSVVAEKRHGDLAFFGGTLHFQIDF